MNASETLATRIESYIALRRSLGYSFQNQAATLRAFARYAETEQLKGPLTRDMVIGFVLSRLGTANHRAIAYRVLCRFCEYLAVYDSGTEALDPRTLPRCRAAPPPRILTDEQLASLMVASGDVSPRYPQRGMTLTAVIGLLASSGLRSGEALPSVPMKVRHRPPGNLHSKARKEHLHHAHGTEPDRGSSGWHRHVRRPQADGCAGASRCVTRTI